MSILSELKKLTGKQNAKVVSEALPDGMGGAFIINATRGEFDDPVSYNDIISAISAGKSVMLRNVKAAEATYFSLKTARDSSYTVEFDYEAFIYSADGPDDPLTLQG